MKLTDEECLEVLRERQRMFVEQTKLISHVVDREFIDRVTAVYERAIAVLEQTKQPMKRLDEAVRDISDMRGGACVHVIQIVPAQPGSGLAFDCQQAGCSGDLAKTYSESSVLDAMCTVLSATLDYYVGLLHEARDREHRAQVVKARS